MMVDDHGTGVLRLIIPVENRERLTAGEQGFLGLTDGAVVDKLRIRSRILTSGEVFKLLGQLFAHIAMLTVELCDNESYLIGNAVVIFCQLQALEQILKGHGGVDNDGFHIADGLNGLVNANGIVNLKVSLADGGTRSCGTAQHLFKEDTGLDSAHKDEGGDFGDVDTCGQQIHRYDDLRVRLVFEAFNGFGNALFIAVRCLAGNLHDRVGIHTACGVDFL